MRRLQVVDLTIQRHPKFPKNRRGVISGPGINGGKWRRLTTCNWWITLTITPEVDS